MKLSQNDKEFLERIKALLDQDTLWIERTMESPMYFVLRGNYGEHIGRKFRLTRQGVRWRFFRLFNQMYITAAKISRRLTRFRTEEIESLVP
jgi:hypothetical protein